MFMNQLKNLSITEITLLLSRVDEVGVTKKMRRHLKNDAPKEEILALEKLINVKHLSCQFYRKVLFLKFLRLAV